MINPCYFLYYKIYRTTYKTNRSIIEWSSMITVSVLVYFNSISLIILTLPEKYIIQFKELVFYGPLALILILNYFIFIDKRKYRKITSSFKKNTRIVKYRWRGAGRPVHHIFNLAISALGCDALII